MKELKAQRTTLKAKVKTSATRLQRGISKKQSETALQISFNDLEAAHIEFSGVAVAYSQAIIDEPALKDEFYTVNQMTCEEYSSDVEGYYTKAVNEYDEYILEKTTADQGDLVAELDRLWEKIDKQDDGAQIERDLRRVETAICKLAILKAKKADHQSVDWEPLIEDINELLRKNEQLEDAANNRLHKIKKSLNPSSTGLPDATNQSPGPPIMSTGFSMLPAPGMSSPTQSLPSMFSMQPAPGMSSPTQSLPSMFSMQPAPGMSSPTQSLPSMFSMQPAPGMSSPAQSLPSMFSQLQVQPPHSMYPMPVSAQSMPSMFSQLQSQTPLSSMHHMSTSAQLASLSSQQVFNPNTTPSTSLLPHCSLGSNTIPPVSLQPYFPLVSNATVPSPTLLTSPPAQQPFMFTNPAASASTPAFQQLLPQQIDPSSKIPDLPKFSGLRQDWPEFECVWPYKARNIQCRVTLALELRRCCKDGHAEPLLRNIAVTGQGSFYEMWRRLCDHYGDEASTVSEILKKLQSLKPVQPEDYRSFVEFANKIEGCYTQLSSLNQFECISMLQVDSLAALLPTTAREVWHELYQRLSTPDKLHPFRAFASYLVSKRKDVSRLAELQSTASKRKETTTHHVGARQEENLANEDLEVLKPNCAVCKNPYGHGTDKCFVFERMTRDEKVSALMDVDACFRCFLYHPRGRCSYRQPCAKCNKTGHHTLMCMTRTASHSYPDADRTTGSDIVVPATSHCTERKPSGVYAIFSARVLGSKNICTVFTDDGSDSSYITNSAARRLGAKSLGKYNLHLTTTGRQERDIESTLYELDIVTASGRKVTLRMFGIDQITGKLGRLNISVLSKLFPEMDTTRLQRNSHEVDVLLGTDYFGLHPKWELATAGEHLSVMEGELGICLQGSHPFLQLGPESENHSSMMNVLRTATAIRVEAHQGRGEELRTPIRQKCGGSCKYECKEKQQEIEAPVNVKTSERIVGINDLKAKCSEVREKEDRLQSIEEENLERSLHSSHLTRELQSLETRRSSMKEVDSRYGADLEGKHWGIDVLTKTSVGIMEINNSQQDIIAHLANQNENVISTIRKMIKKLEEKDLSLEKAHSEITDTRKSMEDCQLKLETADHNNYIEPVVEHKEREVNQGVTACKQNEVVLEEREDQEESEATEVENVGDSKEAKANDVVEDKKEEGNQKEIKEVNENLVGEAIAEVKESKVKGTHIVDAICDVEEIREAKTHEVYPGDKTSKIEVYRRYTRSIKRLVIRPVQRLMKILPGEGTAD